MERNALVHVRMCIMIIMYSCTCIDAVFCMYTCIITMYIDIHCIICMQALLCVSVQGDGGSQWAGPLFHICIESEMHNIIDF